MRGSLRCRDNTPRQNMYVIKRDGRREAVKFDKITARVKKLCYGLDPMVDATAMTMKVPAKM